MVSTFPGTQGRGPIADSSLLAARRLHFNLACAGWALGLRFLGLAFSEHGSIDLHGRWQAAEMDDPADAILAHGSNGLQVR